MNTFWMAAGGWWVQAALSGGAVLLLGWVGMRVCRRPALRQQIGAWAVRGAVLAAVLSALPQWVLLPKPDWMPRPTAEVSGEPICLPADDPPPGPQSSPQPAVAELPEVDPDPVEWVWVPRAALPLDAPVVAPEPTPAEQPVASPKGEEAPAACDAPVAQPTAGAPDWSAVVPLLLAAYFAAVGWFALPLLRERLALWWLLRRSAPLTGRARWVFDRLTDDQPRPRAVVSDLIRTPLCAGFFRPLVVLPRTMAERADATVLRWVLAHELCHLRRGDTRTAHWVAAARAVFFFLPWFWAVRKELSLCQEFLADAAASADTDGTAADYAAFLVDLSDGPNARLSLAARMRAGKSDLYRRVTMLLSAKREIAREAPRGFTVVAGVLAVGAAVGLSGLGFAADPPKDVVKEKPKVVVEEVVVETPGDVARPADAEVKKLQAELDRLRKALEVDGPVQFDRAQVDALKKKLEALDKRLKGTDPARPVPVLRELPADVLKPVEVEVKVRDGKGVLRRVPAPPAKPLDRPTMEILPRDNLQLVPVVERLQPPADVVRPRGGAVALPVESDLRKQYEEQLKQFEESIRKAADAEAKEQLEKARDEYKKAMEEPLKKADAARKELDAARKKLDEAEKANRFQNDDGLRRLIEKQKEMEKRLLQEFGKGLELPFNPEDLKRFDMVFGDGLFVPGGVRRNAAQPRLGVMLEKVSPVLAEQLDLPKENGLVVVEVMAGSPAEKAGVKKNDVLLTLADKDVPTDPEAFTAMVGKLKAGEKVDAVVMRKGKKVAVKGIELPEARRPAGGGGVSESIQVQVNDDDATLTATVDKTAYTVTGKVENGKLVPAKITIGEGKDAKTYDSLDKVPQAQRDTVVRLMGKIRVVGK